MLWVRDEGVWIAYNAARDESNVDESLGTKRLSHILLKGHWVKVYGVHEP